MSFANEVLPRGRTIAAKAKRPHRDGVGEGKAKRPHRDGVGEGKAKRPHRDGVGEGTETFSWRGRRVPALAGGSAVCRALAAALAHAIADRLGPGLRLGISEDGFARIEAGPVARIQLNVATRLLFRGACGVRSRVTRRGTFPEARPRRPFRRESLGRLLRLRRGRCFEDASGEACDCTHHEGAQKLRHLAVH